MDLKSKLVGFAILSKLQECNIQSDVKLENKTDRLISDRGIDYTPLRDLLAAGKWEEADRETTVIALRICNRLTEGWLTEEDIQNFPCTDLFTIDQLWVKYSKGKFGYSVQASIWEQIGGTWNAQYLIYKLFSQYIGWGDGNSTWVTSTKNLTFDTTAPAGHLPGGMLDWLWFKYREVAPDGVALEAWWNILSALTSKLEECENLFNPNKVNLLSPTQNSIRNRIAVVEGDIVRQRVDAIVNPTDEIFSGSGGVDHLIHNAAGFQLREACRQLKKCATGEVKITSGYNLSARWVIHTVGPFWRGGYYREGEILAQCYRNCLRLAEQYSIKTIAFPAISTGTFRFPIELASNIAVRTVKGFLEKNTSIERVVFVCFGEKSYDCYLTAVKEILG